ncbi:unnamed protein product [Bursaphelenchus okinawaensis]|uniref:G_PROTEIN_RECEP_F1_2 domain-containing protein n=1 Tax=Bursaphelenchus okinawaensis TaxID=465554 RepID=A0A811L6F6_9BILA|nr:unnamed protein product [Bursaphelenchus okinawaensis]CAG9119016.1 unnamed protein product [Bursaphelenchus okinawaensis]
MSVLGNHSHNTDCLNVGNASEQAAFMKHRREELQHIYKVYYGLIPFPLGVVALACATLYSVACFRAIRAHRVSRKSYVLLLNRSLGDISTCIWSFVICAYVHAVEYPSPEIVQVIDSVFMGCFWAGMTSYVALSFLKFYAVARPLDYRNNITMRRCIYLICLSWFIFFVMVCYSVGASALSNIESLRDWSGCRKETCQRSFYRFRNTCVCVVYCSTLVCFAGTVILIKRHQRFTRIHSRKAENTEQVGTKPNKKKLRDRFPLWKLAVNVCTFAIFDVFYVIWGASLLIGADKCFYMRNFTKMAWLLSFLHLSILFRIILDPCIAFFVDIPIRRSMLQVLGLQDYLKSRKAAKLEYNSSETPARTASTSNSNNTRNSTVRTRLGSLT